ncbi:hypothetical protein CDD83_7239 [Cordyceps sp. RAO-2017]|nr:hypothetical protein CDD83_7239 [Cordyceps sp. RAO-2017]
MTAGLIEGLRAENKGKEGSGRGHEHHHGLARLRSGPAVRPPCPYPRSLAACPSTAPEPYPTSAPRLAARTTPIDVTEFLVFHVLTGLAAASYMSTGGGTVADLLSKDLLSKEKRGLFMASFTVRPLFGPVCCPPTPHPPLGPSTPADGAGTTRLTLLYVRRPSYKQPEAHALTRPLEFLFTSPAVAFTALFIALNLGGAVLLVAPFPTVHENVYHGSIRFSGLVYVGVGVGTAICGPGAVIINSSSQTYIINLFRLQAAASALNAIKLPRNRTGAFQPLAALSLHGYLDLG